MLFVSLPTFRRARPSGVPAWLCASFGLVLASVASLVSSADETFVYSSQGDIRGINLTIGSDNLLSTAPGVGSANGLAINSSAGLVYYGDATRVYRWNQALGAGPLAHSLMNDFAIGPVQAPITNIDSASGSFLDGVYYVGSETDAGYIDDVYALTMSVDGTQIVSVDALDLQGACNCSGVQLGGFGDTAAVLEGGQPVLYGASTDISGNGSGTSAGRWRFVPATGAFTLLSTAPGGQMSGSPSGAVYTNVGNSVRTFDTTTGAVGTASLFTLAAAPFDFTEGFNFDFGDAPDSYGGAFHRLGSQGAIPVFIGSVEPDNDPGTLNAQSGSIDGLGDDLAGVDDEDALGTPPPLDTGDASYTLTVACSVGARVAAWVDFDGDGGFDALERNTNHPVTCAVGQATLDWSALPGLRAGPSMIRLRASTNAAAVSVPTGIATDGEVEDHRLTIAEETAGTNGTCAANEISSRYTPTDLPVAIGPNAATTAISRIIVPDSLLITDVNLLGITGVHTYINDLVFSLDHEGTVNTLYGPSCGSQNDFSFSFDDERSGGPPCPPTDGGSYPPSQALAVHDGADASGRWDLRILDRFNGDGGELQGWTLEICSVAPVIEAPGIAIAKSASVDGRDVAVGLFTQNTGNVALADVQVRDDLDLAFGAGNYTVSAGPTLLDAPAGVALDPGWTGATGNDALLATGATLPVDGVIEIEFTVTVDTVQPSSTPGEYSNQATASGTSPVGTPVFDLSGDTLSVTDDVPTPIVVEASASLSGRTFEDTSAESNVAHDGIPQSGESGVGGRVVRVLDADGEQVAETRSDFDGRWTVAVPATATGPALRIIVEPADDTRFVSESPVHGNGSPVDGEITVSVDAGGQVDGIDFGVVALPTLVSDHDAVAEPGSAVRHAHRYRSPSHGTLVLSTTGASDEVSPVWPSRLVRDLGCDGRIDPSDVSLSPLPSMLTVAFDETVCFVADVFVPSDAPGGARQTLQLETVLVLTDRAGTGHGTSFSLANRDTTRVVGAGAGRLVLEKTVRNITLDGPESESNTGLRGHILEYIVRYRNDGTSPIADLVVDDSAPAFTEVLVGSVSCDQTPPSMVCTPGGAGASVDWRFGGTLGGGEGGRVSYRVRID